MKLSQPVLLLCLAASSAVAETPASAPAPPTLERFDASGVDKSIDPCVDFQQYACGSFFKQNPIPPDQVAWGKASPLQLWNETILRETLEAAVAKTTGHTPIEQKIGDYYAACMDEPGVEATAPTELAAELARIEAITSKSQLVDLLAHIHARYPGVWLSGDNQTNAAVFGFSAVQDFDDATRVLPQFDQGGMNLPGRDFYLAADERSTGIRAKYAAHVTRMLVLSGVPEAQAKTDAGLVLALETELARAAMDNVRRRDPRNQHNVMTLAQVQALTPSFDFARYLAQVGAPKAESYQVTSPEFFRGLEKLIQGQPLAQWKAYLRYSSLHAAAPSMQRSMVQENWDFYAHTLAGAQEMLPRWRRCVRAADRDLGEALGQAYVARAFPPESKARTTELVTAVEAALDKDIDGLAWMTPATKQKAKQKLSLILDKVGYPDKWLDYSSVAISRTNPLANVAAASQHEFARWLEKIGKPVDRLGWIMTPPTINAYYDAQMNTINFPAGILQPPFFDATQDPAVNFGAIGAVVGHEITHGFDDQGRKFDGQGNLRDWWTEGDAKAYDARGKCISDQYTQEMPELGVKTNGLLTQGEDTADNGGLYLAMFALEATLAKQGKGLEAKGTDGLTSLQRFFLGFANDWCTQLRPEIARTVILSNPHSLAKFRVNNVVSNMPEFAKAFGCTRGQPMVRENACRVW